ncbi:MAG: hypothetical protein H0W11_03615 [Gemmatimonadetes bacterium]|jgi:polyhydroxyalkanoate synthesis regulator phasin|nr:hypothetical protein [Gemmatimonadota bacterium]
MPEEQDRTRGGRSGIGEGIRTGVGILSAFRDAIEETIQEAANRGDLSPDRARDAVRSAAARVQESLGDARERLDFVPRREFDELRTEVATLRAELAELRGRSEPSGGLITPHTGAVEEGVASASWSPGGETGEEPGILDDAPELLDTDTERTEMPPRAPGGFPVDDG